MTWGQIVVFTVIKNNLVLVEKRAKDSTWANELLFPGGKVEENETIEQALIREVKEEVGIEVEKFEKIPSTKKIIGYKGVIVNPFLITKYKGEIGEKVLDKGNPLLWVKIDSLFSSKKRAVSEVAIATSNFIHNL